MLVKFHVCRMSSSLVKTGVGIEPTCSALQAAPWPLGHPVTFPSRDREEAVASVAENCTRAVIVSDPRNAAGGTRTRNLLPLEQAPLADWATAARSMAEVGVEPTQTAF